jgi:hypothetical protein
MLQTFRVGERELDPDASCWIDRGENFINVITRTTLQIAPMAFPEIVLKSLPIGHLASWGDIGQKVLMTGMGGHMLSTSLITTSRLARSLRRSQRRILTMSQIYHPRRNMKQCLSPALRRSLSQNLTRSWAQALMGKWGTNKRYEDIRDSGWEDQRNVRLSSMSSM